VGAGEDAVFLAPRCGDVLLPTHAGPVTELLQYSTWFIG
jgi:hypothetical protein